MCFPNQWLVTHLCCAHTLPFGGCCLQVKGSSSSCLFKQFMQQTVSVPAVFQACLVVDQALCLLPGYLCCSGDCVPSLIPLHHNGLFTHFIHSSENFEFPEGQDRLYFSSRVPSSTWHTVDTGWWWISGFGDSAGT